jgi:hypothetical protein
MGNLQVSASAVRQTQLANMNRMAIVVGLRRPARWGISPLPQWHLTGAVTDMRADIRNIHRVCDYMISGPRLDC